MPLCWRKPSLNMKWLIYFTMKHIILLLFLFILELVYLKIATKCNIIDKPNPRSSHKKAVLRGGGIIILLGVWIFSYMDTADYTFFVIGMTLISIIAFWDDVHSLSPRLRFLIQFVAMALLLREVEMFQGSNVWYVLPVLVLGVCIINAYNFMDGINGITGAYSLMVLFSFWLLNRKMAYIDATLIEILMIAAFVFCLFNFRNKAICFAGDVGSVGIAYCIIFVLLKLILYTGDITYLIFLVVYGIDTLCTIIHRIILHENLLQPHRKHLFQLLVNEGNLSHVVVASIYVVLQFAISLGYIYLPINRWVYVTIVVVVLGMIYLLIEQKLYPLHKIYLEQLSNTSYVGNAINSKINLYENKK